jgi:predicted nucleic acid-binding protein
LRAISNRRLSKSRRSAGNSDAAETWHLVGDEERAKELFEQVLDSESRMYADFRVAYAGFLLDSEEVERAYELLDQVRRCSDRQHLASAVLLGDELTDFVTYDQRLAATAQAAHLPVRAPGSH